MSILHWLAPLSSCLVMLHLGTQVMPQQKIHLTQQAGWRLALVHYLAPLVTVFILTRFHMLSTAESAALAICILAGVGTSAVPLALNSGASANAVTDRIMLSAIIAFISLPLVAMLHAPPQQVASQTVLVVIMLGLFLWLPWLAGRYLGQKVWFSQQLKRRLGTLASLSVAALIGMVAWLQLPMLLNHPWLMLASAVIVLVQGLGAALFDAQHGLAVTAVVRNLTLATLILTFNQQSPTSLTALAAFGLIMYAGVWPTMRLAAAFKNKSLCCTANPPPPNAQH